MLNKSTFLIHTFKYKEFIMGDYASKGVAGSGLGLGIAGTALALLNGNGLHNT